MRTAEEIHTGKVIVADDQPCHLGPVEAILTQAGYEVVTAINGREVLDKAVVFMPQLFLLDVNMPELDGFETCSCLKDDPCFQDAPVIFMSAEDDISSVECAFELGGSDFLAKPFKRAEMLARVNSHLRAYQARKRFRHQVLDEARQLANVASLCLSLAKTVADQNRAGLAGDPVQFAVPEVTSCLAGNAETLAQDIERLIGRDDAGFLRELHRLDTARFTSSSDVLACLGGSYLRAKRRGISLTMPRRPDQFHLNASPGDVKKLLDSFADHFFGQLQRGATCNVFLRRQEPSGLCLHFAASLNLEEGVESDDDPTPARVDLPVPRHLKHLAFSLDAAVEICHRSPSALQMRIVLPADFDA